MLSFLASSTFFKYDQNAGFAFKKFKIFMGGGHAPNTLAKHVRTASRSSPVIPGPLHLDMGYQFFFNLGAQMATAYKS
jgi:hypothetical protein